jgi:hypothetical protein
MTELNWKITSEKEIPVYYYSMYSYPIATAKIGFIQNGFTISDINTGNVFLNEKINGRDTLLFMELEKQNPVCMVIMSDIGYDGNSFREVENNVPSTHRIKINSYRGEHPTRNSKLSEFIEAKK